MVSLFISIVSIVFLQAQSTGTFSLLLSIIGLVIMCGIIYAIFYIPYFFLKKQLLKTNSKEFVRSMKYAIIVPIIQAICLLPMYYVGTEMIKGAMSMDRLRDISTYTPYLGDLGTIAEIANQNGLLPQIERSQEMQELIDIANTTNDFTNIGIFITIILIVLELYGIFHLEKFTKGKMQIMCGIVSIILVIGCFLSCISLNKLSSVLSSVFSDGNISSSGFYIIPIIALLIVSLLYRLYSKSLDIAFKGLPNIDIKE
ncbi:hypothetical protein DXB82_00140 [Phocaeicola vulgatus]|jgi:hypothetical protein|uniref:hypothetical protein n=1 Tax=Phocaeicola vulgatus TaxID=821 RepID=UPI000E435F44|nr:hypothetical protein [Phocaeicola vulgatus]RGM91199.1 hypothetical protein DXB90_00835 [Phocaeicola vulgatus]RGN09800.1 hypothetical protein DXB82_00140 [Phocaeicola vulgatus]